MAASPYSIDPTTYLDELLAQASPDLMREMLQGFINQILSTQADQICGAEYATTSKSRTNVRNGYRHRDLDTRVDLTPIWWTPDIQPSRAGKKGNLPPC
ncbi:transposase, partial [Corynebacterium accolens]|uniref:transposase n=1 Tax=Corynebacterium accolens TaxID=38284 RepID=UPI0025434E0E